MLQNADYTTGQIFDLSEKLEQSENSLVRSAIILGADPLEKKSEDKLSKATKDSCKTTIEVIHGLMTQIIKNRLFNQVSCQTAQAAGNGGCQGESSAATTSGDVAMEWLKLLQLDGNNQLKW